MKNEEMAVAVYENIFETGLIRNVETADGKVWFVANDVAKVLGYKDTKKAITRHCKKATSLSSANPLSIGGGVDNSLSLYALINNRSVPSMIPESDVYRLIMYSRIPQAEVFQDWVFEEVLPHIRKYGWYSTRTETKTLFKKMSDCLKNAGMASDPRVYIHYSNLCNMFAFGHSASKMKKIKDVKKLDRDCFNADELELLGMAEDIICRFIQGGHRDYNTIKNILKSFPISKIDK